MSNFKTTCPSCSQIDGRKVSYADESHLVAVCVCDSCGYTWEQVGRVEVVPNFPAREPTPKPPKVTRRVLYVNLSTTRAKYDNLGDYFQVAEDGVLMIRNDSSDRDPFVAYSAGVWAMAYYEEEEV